MFLPISLFCIGIGFVIIDDAYTMPKFRNESMFGFYFIGSFLVFIGIIAFCKFWIGE
jgi:hypothetical protein